MRAVPYQACEYALLLLVQAEDALHPRVQVGSLGVVALDGQQAHQAAQHIRTLAVLGLRQAGERAGGRAGGGT